MNHLRRIWTDGERGNSLACIKRIGRSILRPQDPNFAIETILSIERRHGFRSTFFLLEDPTFSRLGGRYYLADVAVKEAVRLILDAGSEVAVHGSFFAFNSKDKYEAQKDAFASAFGFEPRGIRNHYLHHSGKITWKAQVEAGFEYDASLGFTNRVGVPGGKLHPFFPLADNERDKNFVALPLTIMDAVLIQKLNLTPEKAFELCKQISTRTIKKGGLLSILWHNHYFAEPEYIEWELLYDELIGWLECMNPWNATGNEISAWWTHRHFDKHVLW